MASETSGPPAGWYPHPSMVGTQRYWDGSGWTDHVAPASPPAAPQTPPADHSGLIVAGWLTAFIIPIVGFVLGCVLVSKSSGHASAIIVISVISALLWWTYLSAPSVGY